MTVRDRGSIPHCGGILGLELRWLPLFHHGLSVFRGFARLCRELLDDSFTSRLRLELHPSSLPFKALNLYLVVLELELVLVLIRSLLPISLPVQVLLVLSVLDVYRQSLWNEESEPVHGLRIETSFGESVLPVGDAQVHDHQAEVVCETVG